MITKRFSGLAKLIFSLLVICGVLTAQDYRARVQGTVTDQTQAAVAGATMTLTNTATGVERTQQSDPTGHYLFDLVEPGTYALAAEAPGFSKSIQENVSLQTRADLTVDFALKPGNLQQTITVTGEPVAVQFNTAKLETTVDTVLTERMPQVYRSPFLLAQLDPSVVPSKTNGDWNPFNSWGPGSQSIGGGADYSNDLQLDGTPTGIGVKNSFQPSQDSVEEVNVQQNSIDAEFGHSAGSAITMITKSGTNDWHGLAFYQGQFPWANALEDRINPAINLDRKNIIGGTFGNPILKNKLFNFASYEQWLYTQPTTLTETLPTALERQGNFSQSLNEAGGLRTIYDPYTTVTDSAGNVTRFPYPNNIIPTSQIDPIAAKYTAGLWNPNRPGEGPYHINNYVASLPVDYPYKNFSDRVDYYVSEKIRIYGRVSVIRTPATTSNPTGSDLFQNDRGSLRNANQFVGNVTYTINPTTVVTVRGDYHSFVDASNFVIPSGSPTFSTFWPNQSFYAPIYASAGIPKLVPRVTIFDPTGLNQDLVLGASGGYWQQRPNQDQIAAQISQERGKHYLKGGFELRSSRVLSTISNQNPGFGFDPGLTSTTYVNPYNGPTNLSGDGYATFLIGAVAPTNEQLQNGSNCWACGSTDMPINIVPTTRDQYYGAFINDDWKISRKLTLNLGLRYENTTPYSDAQDRLTAPLNLTVPISQMQGANAPQMPALVSQYYPGSWTFNGAYQFESSSTPVWNHKWGSFSPRAGFAYRLNDKTSIRAGYGRYYTPWDAMQQEEIESPNYYGFQTTTGAPNAIQGVPQMTFSNPFPATNPITPATGKSLGANTGLGDSVSFVNPNRPLQHSDRINISVQRELPGGIVADITYFINFTNNLCSSNYCFTSANLDMMDPRLFYKYGNALNQVVANPFYNFGTVSQFPGPLRYQPQVTIAQLMVPYPQYTGITEVDGLNGANMHYQSLQIRFQKRFSKGYSFLAGYNYHREQDQVYYDSVAQYLNQWSWVDGGNARHRLTASGTWALPLGKGREYLSSAPRLVDALVGGWNLTGLLTYQSGAPIKFTGVQVTGNPGNNVTPGAYFNTSVVKLLPGFTEETNPWYYPGVLGPHFFNVDASLVKDFHVTERIIFSLRMDAFNALNNANLNAPNMSVGSAQFGRSTDILSNTFGRQLQLGGRISF
jgi:Carboxypeptidase regulatory-like domain/TonB dependent receptor